ncbi:MAG TPA: hypothetical protein PK854_05780 [Oscillospiraceae bacterium]|nr:hypothetical protein [Oscillospiraceae bacterium]
MMKKLIAAALLLVLVVSMFGCTNSNPPTRGIITDGVYSNAYFGISFKIPDGWRALTDEEYKARFTYGLPTNEELAEFESEFRDAYILNTADETDYMIISYSMLFDKGSNNDQVKNKLAMVAQKWVFGLITKVKIGDVDYAMMSGTQEGSTKTMYYLWSQEMKGDFRPLIWAELESSESFDAILANFSTFSTDK